MTLFSESGILSVKTGGQREIAQMEEQEKQRLFEIAGKYERLRLYRSIQRSEWKHTGIPPGRCLWEL